MTKHDLHILRGAAVPTAVAGVGLGVWWLLADGVSGLVGAALGIVVVGAFFTLGVLAVGYASRVSPFVMMQVAIGTYVVKIVVLGALLMLFQDTQAFNTKALAWTILVATLVWTAGEVRAFSREKILYVDPGKSA